MVPFLNFVNSMNKNSALRRAVFLLLAANLALGIGYIAILPPWEGFDETAHYSSLQQIADTKTIPKYGSARISRDVETYSEYAPIPYSGHLPVEQNGGFTYKSFFESNTGIIQRGSNYINSDPITPRNFIKGEKFNWQSQHPPLYYLIVAPVYLVTKNLSWLKQLFVLRLLSYFFAWSALAVGAFTCLPELKGSVDRDGYSLPVWVLTGLGFWPLIFPSWFSDMARIGNDSLCALLISLIWLVLLKFKNDAPAKLYIILGILFGIGCLIKAFFIPIIAGLFVYLFLYRWKKEGRAGIKSNLLYLLLTLSIAAIISGWWYFMNWYNYGVILGSDEMIRLKTAGGLLTNLFKNFSLLAWLRGNAAAITTFAWAGTWSFARPPYLFLVLMTLTVLFAAGIYLYAVHHYNLIRFEWLPAWFTLPVIAGFGYHILIRIALIGEGRGTGGYYLHILVVPLIFALGIGLKNIWKIKAIRISGMILAVYAIIFSTILFFCQIWLYTGIMHIAGNRKFYQLSDGFDSLFNIPEILSRLDVIGFPYLSLLFLISGLILLISGFRLLSVNRIRD